MKTFAVISSFLLLLTSCHSSDDMASEEIFFTVNFGYDTYIKQHIDRNVLPETFAKLKTRDDLIDFYKNRHSAFLPVYSSMTDNNESIFVKVEYMLAQECFSDRCNSQTRKEVLQLVAGKQKGKYDHERYVYRHSPIRTGIFLMAVILVKERKYSARYIDAVTLQKALLSISRDIFENEEVGAAETFSNLMIECSKNYLNNSKK